LLSRAIIAAVSYDRSVFEAQIKVGINPMPSIVLEASTAWVRPIGEVEVTVVERMFLVLSQGREHISVDALMTSKKEERLQIK
jgi:hypothetical protein